MYKHLWIQNHASICSIIIYGSNNAKVRAFSGFKIKDFIVTDDMVCDHKDGKEIEINFYKDDGLTINKSVRLLVSDFIKLLPSKSDFENLGFALIPHVFPQFSDIPELRLCKHCDNPIGISIGIIGYQFEHNNLSMKSGVVSSFIEDRGRSIIQYDGTIKPGNSGAPLINLNTGSIIGIVNNKLLGIVKSFKEMSSIIDNNLEVLRKFEGRHKLDDMDIVQVLIANQHQVKRLSQEFFKNATVRVGYALEISHLREFVSLKQEVESGNENTIDGSH
jgi:hypothetical protein